MCPGQSSQGTLEAVKNSAFSETSRTGVAACLLNYNQHRKLPKPCGTDSRGNCCETVAALANLKTALLFALDFAQTAVTIPASSLSDWFCGASPTHITLQEICKSAKRRPIVWTSLETTCRRRACVQ